MVIFRSRVPGLSQFTLERFALRARRASGLQEPVNILLTTDSELRALNRRFRGIDKATDVLSFPMPPAQPRSKRTAGDIAISVGIARENSRRMGHSVAQEIKILTLHGILHLAGFDHEQDNGEMARRERLLRRQLKLEAGMIERTQAKVREPRPDSEPRSTYSKGRAA